MSQMMNMVAGEPASGSLPLRVLHLYALVGTGGLTITPLHAKPVRLIVDAPPARWAWGQELPDDDRPRFDPRGVWPERARDSLGEHWRYSSAASDAIWWHAAPYRSQLLCLQGQVLGSASLWQRCVGHQMIHVWHAAANNLRNLHCHGLVADGGQP